MYNTDNRVKKEKISSRIGIMGGTFDPIHYGHLLIAENACEQFGLEQTVFMPTGNPPHKNSLEVTDAAYRSEMVRIAISGNRHFSFSDYELEKKGTCYTVETLEAFRRQFPASGLYFIMGADSLAYFGSWSHPERISELATILVAVRDSLDQEELLGIRRDLEERFCTKIGFISTPNFSVSSQMIRKRASGRQSIRYLVPDAVERYIYENGLYTPAHAAFNK